MKITSISTVKSFKSRRIRLIIGIFLFIIVYLTKFFFDIDGISRQVYPIPHFDVSLIPNQSGKVIIITGGTAGVGRASAEQLCKKDAKLIIITSRSQASADKAAKEIKQQFCSMEQNQSKVIGRALALEDHKSIKKFADWFKSLNEPLHVLMLNAGLGTLDDERTSLELEKTIGVNWFGHFYLQHLLQNAIEQSAPSRIVIVSSNAGAMASPIIHPIEEYVTGDEAKGANRYMISKLFNIYHANELHRRLRERGVNNVYVNSLHPGLVATNIFDYLRGHEKFPFNYVQTITKVLEKEFNGGLFHVFLSLVVEIIGLSPLNGALTQLYAATSPDIERFNISGEYLYPIARREDKSWYYFGKLSYLPQQAKDQVLAQKVWRYGESLISKIANDDG